MKKLLIIAIAIIGIVFANSSNAMAMTHPSFQPNNDGGYTMTLWDGPLTHNSEGIEECVGPATTVCKTIIVKGSVNISQGPNGPVGTLPVGTRIHIWKNFLVEPYGVLNAKLTSPFNLEDSVSPEYEEDELSTRTNNEGDLETTPILE